MDPQINSSLFSYIFKRANIFSFIDFPTQNIYITVFQNYAESTIYPFTNHQTYNTYETKPTHFKILDFKRTIKSTVMYETPKKFCVP